MIVVNRVPGKSCNAGGQAENATQQAGCAVETSRRKRVLDTLSKARQDSPGSLKIKNKTKSPVAARIRSSSLSRAELTRRVESSLAHP